MAGTGQERATLFMERGRLTGVLVGESDSRLLLVGKPVLTSTARPKHRKHPPRRLAALAIPREDGGYRQDVQQRNDDQNSQAARCDKPGESAKHV